MPLEVLDGAFVLLGRCPRFESTEIPELPGFLVFLAGVQTIFTRLELSNHGHPDSSSVQA
jgi:hypothetical protein